MALKVFDGFDHYAALADIQARKGALQWGDIAANLGVSFVAGRSGIGYALALTLNSYPVSSDALWFGGSFGFNLSTGYVGAAFEVQQSASLSSFSLKIMDYVANAVQFTVRFTCDGGVVSVWPGDPDSSGYSGSMLAASPPNAFNPFIWQMIEVGATIGASGSFDVHVNGSSVVSGTGATQSSSNAFFNGLRIFNGGSTLNTFLYVDDFYVCDSTTGPGTYPCNTFLGDVAVRTLKTTGNSSVTWTPLANANWQEVGETQFDGDTSYNYATTVGNQDLFTFGSLPTTVATVFGVQTTGAYRKLDASAQTIIQSIKSGGTSSNGATLSLSLSYAYYTDLFVVDPNTSATWTPAAVDALIAGYKLNS